LAALQAAPDRTASIIVQGQVGARIASFHPAVDASLFCLKCFRNGRFRRLAVGPCRSRRNALSPQPLSQLFVGRSNVFLQRVAASLFIASKIVAFGYRRRFGCALRWVASTWADRRSWGLSARSD
jgi:hypothetical protein